METIKDTIIGNIEKRNVKNLKIPAFESLGKTQIDYDTFFKIVDTYAKAFKELGVKENDIVTICSAGTVDTVLNFAALNKIGAVSQFVNPKHFNNNSKKYINDTNSKLLICLDRFYPVIKDSLKETNIEQVISSSISEYSSFLYKILAHRKPIRNSDKIDGVKYIDLPEFIKLGEKSRIKIPKLEYEPNKSAVIAYTSGTTGNPKGVIHTNDSINNMIQIYDLANGIGGEAGDRNLVLIPPMYLTSLVHEIITPLSMGATNIMQPDYKPENFGKDLMKYYPKATVGTKSHYLSLENNKFSKDSLSFLKLPYCGGEAFSKDTAIRINNLLKYYGAEPMIIGYGQSEYGTMTMFNYDINNRTNESGILLPTVEAKIIDPITGEPVKKGERGEIYIHTPTIMKGYLNNPVATKKFFAKDEEGKIWGRSGDIASIGSTYNGKDVFNVVGRRSDAFTDKNGQIVYLFDIENKVEEVKGVKTAEVVSLIVDNREVPIVHLIVDEDYKKENLDEEVLRMVNDHLIDSYDNSSYIPYAYKIRDNFSVSSISGKRDYEILKQEKEGYLRFTDDNNIEPFSFINNSKVKKIK